MAQSNKSLHRTATASRSVTPLAIVVNHNLSPDEFSAIMFCAGVRRKQRAFAHRGCGR